LSDSTQVLIVPFFKISIPQQVEWIEDDDSDVGDGYFSFKVAVTLPDGNIEYVTNQDVDDIQVVDSKARFRIRLTQFYCPSFKLKK
jgi:hypothetical protein